MAVFRPTPVSPFPETGGDGSQQGEARALPPELGPDAIAVVSGATFMYSDPAGDVPAGTVGGLVHRDTRLLSRWELTLDGRSPLVLRSTSLEHYLAQFVLTNAPQDGLPANALGIRRLRAIGDALHERVEVQSYLPHHCQFELRLAVGADFADLFEVKSQVFDRQQWITRQSVQDGRQWSVRYEHDEFRAESRLIANPPADRVEGDELVWHVDIDPLQEWRVDLRLALEPDDISQPVLGDIGEVFHRRAPDPSREWLASGATLRSDNQALTRTIRRTAEDLAALRLELDVNGERVILPAAGMPWFLTLFGRDTLITAYQAIAGAPRLAKGALLALARLQGRRYDDFSDEEPGKILHEVRKGELTQQGARPYRPYYGTADATQLWLILLSEYWRWTGDDELVRTLRPHVSAALDWIDHHGDRDGDGYVEYATRSPQGLGNQCWRDSPDGVRFADGRIPVLPIATCELQGYTYDAKLRLAELADGPLADPALATRLRHQAHALFDRFNADFWIDARGGYYAVGLDGDKNRIDSMTSNLGHLLWSGIVPPQRAVDLARQLLTPEMFTGWGVRTLSRADAAYNPLGYHLGTVWPHDNALAVLGLSRYGHRAEANRIALAMLDAAVQFDHRLPEALSGLFRDRTRVAVPYPTACSPQAWAAAAPVSLVRAMLGLDVVDGGLVVDPAIPPEIGRIVMDGFPACGRRWRIDAAGTSGRVEALDGWPGQARG
ncbi:glycogen debranching N-terminal domain-containing protein [Micromonospora sp. NPDC047074]|uniref:amylo-alpha-1,6-glucosidase n=1 Tax=Micromonospora sp. NPDC047074 TaxID=3154339 RepID=UPI0033FEE086